MVGDVDLTNPCQDETRAAVTRSWSVLRPLCHHVVAHGVRRRAASDGTVAPRLGELCELLENGGAVPERCLLQWIPAWAWLASWMPFMLRSLPALTPSLGCHNCALPLQRCSCGREHLLPLQPRAAPQSKDRPSSTWDLTRSTLNPPPRTLLLHVNQRQ